MRAIDNDGRICGFMGVEEKRLEMLFIAPDQRGKGLGRRLINEAWNRFGARFVDVYEQNKEALKFYEHLGFTIRARSERDGQGNPFPILHLEKTI